MLEFRGVWKSFGDGYVLRKIDLILKCGDFIAVVGPNGSGKTTLLKLASGLTSPSKGRVLLSGIDVRKPEAKFSLGYVPHSPLLYRDLTVKENLLYYAGLYGNPNLSKVDELLDELGVLRFMNKEVSELSYGWRRRVDIIRALMHDPPILLIDEPFSGLDSNGKKWLTDLFLKLLSFRRSVLITSPRSSDVRELGARILELREGMLIASSD